MHHFIHGSVKIRLCFPTVLPVQIDITINLFLITILYCSNLKLKNIPEKTTCSS